VRIKRDPAWSHENQAIRGPSFSSSSLACLFARPSDDNLSPCAVKSSYRSRVSLRSRSRVLVTASPITASVRSFSSRSPFSLRLRQDFRLAFSILQGRGRTQAFYLGNNFSTFNTSSSRVSHSSGTRRRLSITFQLTAEPSHV